MKTVSVILYLWLALAGHTAGFKATGFHLYYGSEARALTKLNVKLAKGHVAVVDPRALTHAQRQTLLDRANAVGAKVLGYVSIGELHDREASDFAAFFKASNLTATERKLFPTPTAVEIGRNARFRSRHMDTLSVAWQRFVQGKAARARQLGYHGAFLDTVDTVDHYLARKEWSIPRRIQSVKATMQFIRAIKAAAPRQYVMVNRGLNLIAPKVFVGNATGVEIDGLNLRQKHASNPDAVLWENAFSGSDAWTRAKDAELRTIHAAGHTTVFALGYAESGGQPAGFFRQAHIVGWPAAWARSSTTLHRELATGK